MALEPLQEKLSQQRGLSRAFWRKIGAGIGIGQGMPWMSWEADIGSSSGIDSLCAQPRLNTAHSNLRQPMSMRARQW